jgi:hypothetical protein
MLNDAVMWPTPRANDWKGGLKPGTKSTRAIGDYFLPDMVNLRTPGQLNPMWVEWLMGFPLGWTVLSASETPSSRKSRKS